MQVSHSFWNVCGQYFGESIVLPIFLLAVLWLLKKWKKEKRTAFYAVAATSVLLLYNGVSQRILEILGEGSTYYRFFWICPIVLIIAYGIVELLTSVKEKQLPLLLLVLGLGGYMFSQIPIQSWVNLPENIYQLDNDVIQAADALMELTGGEPTTLVDNGTLTSTIRQYNAKINMTDLYTNLINEILYTDKENYAGRTIQEYLWLNESEYLAVERERAATCRVIESGGLKKAAETENYNLYDINQEKLDENLRKLVELDQKLSYRSNIEYIPIAELQKEYRYIYLSDFGEIEQEGTYQAVIEAIQALDADGVFINAAFSENCGWVDRYQYLLDQLEIPYYCNNESFQTVEQEDVIFCMIDNTKGLTKRELKSFEALKEEEKPVILILSHKLNEKEKLYQAIVEEDSPVVQVLTTAKGYSEKNLLSETVLQFVTPVDEGQMFHIINLEKQ